MISSHAAELLGEDFGQTIGQISVLGDNGRFGDHDTGAGILKVSRDADVIAFTKSFAVDTGAHGDVSIGNEEAGHLLVLLARNRRQ